RAIIVSGGVRISYLSWPVNRVSSRQSTSVHNRFLSSHSGTVAAEFSTKYTHSSLGLRRLLRGLEFTVRLLLSAYFSISINSQFGQQHREPPQEEIADILPTDFGQVNERRVFSRVRTF